MSEANEMASVLIISDDKELVDALVNNNSTGQTFSARDTIQSVLDESSILNGNGITIFDIGTNGNTLDEAIDQAIKLKQQDPTQVLIVAGEKEMLGEMLKSSIQPLIYRAFNKPVSPNQVSLAFSSAHDTHKDLVEKQAAGVDLTVVGPNENNTNLDSLADERKSNTGLFIGLGVVALGILGWLLLSGGDDQEASKKLTKKVAPVQQEAPAEDAEVSASVQRINELNQLAAEALLEDRIIAPKGDNALEYYDQVLAIDAYDTNAYQGKKDIAARLRSSYDELVAGAQFDRALKVINVLQRIEPLNLENDKLRTDLQTAVDAHVKKIQASGSEDEIAKTTAILDKMGADTASLKSAAQALQAEKQMLAKIDAALSSNVLIPPKKDNAYALVSEALKSNSVSKENIAPKVKSLSAKLLNLAKSAVSKDNLEEGTKLAALIKKLNVDRSGLAALNKTIADKEAAKLAAEQTETEVAKAMTPKPEVKKVEPAKIIPAKLVSRAAPKYPSRALKKGTEGWVQVSFVIDSTGKPINIKVVDAMPNNGTFDNAAINAVKKWRFSPARNEETGQPVQSKELKTKVSFKLG